MFSGGSVMVSASIYLLLCLFCRCHRTCNPAEDVASISGATQPDEALDVTVIPTPSLEASSSSGSNSGEACVVCFSTIRTKDEVGLLPCRHLFHAGCLERWLLENNFCPLCRSAAKPTEAQEPPISFEIGSPSRRGGETESDDGDSLRFFTVSSSPEDALDEEAGRNRVSRWFPR